MNQNFNENNIMRIDFNRATENIRIYIEDLFEYGPKKPV